MSRETVAKQLGLCEETTNPLAIDPSNLLTTTDGKEACLGDIQDNDEDDDPMT